MQTMNITDPTPPRRYAITLVLLGMLGCAIVAVPLALAADANRSWSGTWNNKKFNTTGALTCAVIGNQNGQWIARFTGTGLGRPFNYTALITVRTNGSTMTLQGVTRVDGDNYQWSGSISGPTMSGSFRSGTGNNGDFRLQAKK
jgi:hypothetical protein